MAEEWSKARRIGYQYIESLVLADWGATDIVEFLTDQGFGYRWSTMFDDIRALKGVAVSSQYVQRLDPDEFIPRRYMAEVDLWREGKKHWHQPESLRYRMKVVFRDPETGVETTEYRALMSNEEMRKGDAERYVRDVFPWDAYGDGRELVGLDLVSLFHLKGTPY